MPLVPIPDRKPTAGELAPYLQQWNRMIRTNVEHRPLAVRMGAECSWRTETKQKYPNDFHVRFATSVPNYNAYLRSPEWRDIRQRKLRATAYDCECCGRRAIQVHHRDYRPRVLAGEDLSPLVALCRQCHYTVEYDDTGRKRDVWQDKERVLAELMAGRGRMASGRGKGWFELREADLPDRPVTPLAGVQGSAGMKVRSSKNSTPEEWFRTRERERQREYRRLKKLGGGDYWEGQRIENEERRSKMSSYDLGVQDAIAQVSAIERYNAGPSDQCPFAKGTPEEAEYERGWNDAMRRNLQ